MQPNHLRDHIIWEFQDEYRSQRSSEK